MRLHDVAMALDPAVLFETALGSPPDPWQRDVLRTNAHRLLINNCRQSGKSTTVAALAVHTAVYTPHSLTLILSPGERQSKELLRKCVDIYHRLNRPVQAESENKLELELSNGSRIVALPANEGTIRGYSGVKLLLADEASRILDPLMAAVRPMLAVAGGRLVALSTPYGRRGWWYEAWAQSGPTWQRVEIPATACPRITPEFLQEERLALGERLYRQEYFNSFEEIEGQLFSAESIDRAFIMDEAPLVFGRTA